MKKIAAFILFLIVILFFISEDISNKKELEERSIFISYIELSKYISDDISLSKNNIDMMINNIEELKYDINNQLEYYEYYNDEIKGKEKVSVGRDRRIYCGFEKVKINNV